MQINAIFSNVNHFDLSHPTIGEVTQMYKLLIVDDEYEIRIGLANYFPWDSVGFEVAGVCENGLQALEFLAENSVHVILCDVEMPGMNGLEFAQQLREQYANIKLVFLSAHRNFTYVRKAMQYQAIDYILKPTRFQEISDVFERLRQELDKVCGPEQEPDEIIDSIKAIIEKEYATVTLESVAQRVFLNPYYVSKLFKQKTGINFGDYTTQCRMHKAAELLCAHHYKTYEISRLVGYTTPKNFSRAFKKHYGQTPSEYRAEHWRKEANQSSL